MAKSSSNKQGVFEGPITPTDPDTHSPQVPGTDPHLWRFNDRHTLTGARLQFTSFNTLAIEEITVFRLSTSREDRDVFNPSHTYPCRSLKLNGTDRTATSDDANDHESRASNTRVTHTNEKLLSTAPEGRVVEANDSSIFDLNTTISTVSANDEE
jgi:hypothetical protein